MKIVTLKTSRRGERGEMSDIDEDSDIKKRGKGREMSDIDEDSVFEDIKKRGKRRGMRDIDEDSELKTSRRGERGER